ncbi:angiotensin-converting enzyme [Trichonephila inaurata madagascariensis]|uniref:Angiotensin-converting enzyme n=1 Tax=Trichonephila inaurata madagascariensis TaxID=2747483 RepID=A0A8X6WLC1_9ARAC|nr:angiotensin-converting enzyme [Trichonephila inaurata madagascariensis]
MKTFEESKKFPWKSFKDKNETLYRWFKLTAMGQDEDETNENLESKDDENSEKNEDFFSKMIGIYSQVKFCKFRSADKECGIPYDPGFENKAEYELHSYEDKNFEKNMAIQEEKLQPLYKEIHAYIRKKLIQNHKKENIKKNGPIPAHLLGDMYAQTWVTIFPTVKPYPDIRGFPNVTKEMLEKKMKPIDLFIMAENFFTSIGLKRMTPYFWKYSLMERPKDGRSVDCHASAHDFYDGKDYRIKMCSVVDTSTLEVVHHEMGHIEYQMYYAHHPHVFQDSANPGFHEAIGNVISLSVMTPGYLREVGLLGKEEQETDERPTINYLMNMALRYAVSAHYSYIVDYWRNRVYNGTIKEKELNKKYWEYRYFYANILQFQIHQILCKEADHKGPLHECNIYKKKKAGKLFEKLLKIGKSKDWKEILKIVSKNETDKLDSSAMLEYFEPLMEWLKKDNKKNTKDGKVKIQCHVLEQKTLDQNASINISWAKSFPRF